MRTVLFEGMPQFVERKALEDRSTPRIFGSRIFADEILKAFVRYGTADEYWVFERDFNYDFHPAAGSPASRKINIIQPTTVDKFRNVETAVLLTPRPLPQDLIPLRAYLGRSYPIVGFVHALSDVTTAELVFALMCKQLRPGDAIVCSSNAAKRVLQTLLENAANALELRRSSSLTDVHLPVLPLGVFTDDFDLEKGAARTSLGMAQDDIVVLTFGRLTPLAKADLGPTVLTFSEIVKETKRRVKFVIAGDDSRHGDMKTRLESFAAEVGCGNSICVRTNVSRDEKRRLYAAADIFVAPSDHLQETFGIALVEALAAELPIVASDWSGFREVVDEGVDGFLIPTVWPQFKGQMELVAGSTGMEFRNSLLASATVVDQGQLRGRLVALIDNSELRVKLGRHARQKARSKYDWRVVVRSYETLFSELCQAASQQPTTLDGRGNPLCYDAQRVFGHYPTRVLDDEMLAATTPLGRQWLDQHFPLSTLSEIQPDLEVVTTILRNADEPIRFRDLVRNSDSKLGELGATWTAGRLLKYGLVEIVDVLGAPKANVV